MSNRILSYRGLLADGGQDTILLTTKKGEVGYKIIKFQVMPQSTGSGSNEAAVSLWKENPTTAPQEIDFSDNRLIGCAYFLRDQGTVAISSETIIFDQEIFNQDIYVNYQDAQGSGGSMNYYLELEVIKLSEDQAMVATLKDIRNNA